MVKMTQDEIQAVAQAISEARTGNTLSYRHFVPEAQAAIAALDAARGDPVARVVEWLRELSGDEPLPTGCTKGEVWVLRRAADAIERGEPFRD